MEDRRFDDATLEVVYDLFSGVPERQLDAVNALDGKAAQLFAAGSVVLGFTAVGTSDLWPPLVVAAVLAYAGLTWKTVAALKPRPWRAWRDPWGTWKSVWRYDATRARYALLARLRDDVPTNAGWIREKGDHVRVSLRWLAAEVVFVGLAVVTGSL
jgi:hypothetical protein